MMYLEAKMVSGGSCWLQRRQIVFCKYKKVKTAQSLEPRFSVTFQLIDISKTHWWFFHLFFFSRNRIIYWKLEESYSSKNGGKQMVVRWYSTVSKIQKEKISVRLKFNMAWMLYSWQSFKKYPKWSSALFINMTIYHFSRSHSSIQPAVDSTLHM